MSGKFHSGQMNMPIFALGTWKATDEEIDIALNAAIDVGCRNIDSSHGYSNETGIGKSLKKIFESGKVTREEMFIATKLPPVGNRSEDVEYFLKKSLEAFQLDYLDLFASGPMGFQRKGDVINPLDENGAIIMDYSTDIISVWKAMEEQVKAGRTRHIGLLTVNQSQLQRILDVCEIRPANVQIELHPYFQQKELVSFCKMNNITVSAFAPFGAPGMKYLMGVCNEGISEASNKTFIENTIPLNIKGIAKEKMLYTSKTTQLRGTVGRNPTEEPVIIEMAKKYKKIPTQIILRFWIERGVTVSIRSVNPKRIRQHIDIFDFELTKEECEKISLLEKGGKASFFGRMKRLFPEMGEHPEFPDVS